MRRGAWYAGPVGGTHARRAEVWAVRGLETGRVGSVRNQPLIGRDGELAEFAGSLARVRDGDGQLLLLAGEAGVGKTRLAEEALAQSELLILRGGASQGATPPYGPIVAALRSYLRALPNGPSTGSELLPGGGPLAGHLALLLPELGPPPERTERATLVEAIGRAFAGIARLQPTAVFLDDLQWADGATLELLPELVGQIEHEPLLIVGSYRSDEITRGHPLRRTRADLRRAGRCREIELDPLTPQQAAALAAGVFGRPPCPALAAALYDRAQGLPFFVEELAAALAASGRLEAAWQGSSWPAASRSRSRKRSATPCSCGRRGSPSRPGRRSRSPPSSASGSIWIWSPSWRARAGVLEEPIERGLVVEIAPGQAEFRHALTREALYGELPWPRRRTLHRQLAAHLEQCGLPASQIAEHWLAARDFEPARSGLACCRRCLGPGPRVPGCRPRCPPGARALARRRRRARAAGRARTARPCAELSGELVEAGRVWREVATAYQIAGRWRELAEVQQRLAMVFELRGAGESALAARQAAAEAFEVGGLPGEAAAERVAAAEHLNGAGRFSAALELVVTAAAEAATSGRADLQARALGLEGEVRAALGQPEAGLQAIRAGLALALDRDLAGPAGWRSTTAWRWRSTMRATTPPPEAPIRPRLASAGGGASRRWRRSAWAAWPWSSARPGSGTGRSASVARSSPRPRRRRPLGR